MTFLPFQAGHHRNDEAVRKDRGGGFRDGSQLRLREAVHLRRSREILRRLRALSAIQVHTHGLPDNWNLDSRFRR